MLGLRHRRPRLVIAVAVACAVEVAAYLGATRVVSADGFSAKLLGSAVYPVMEAVAMVLLVLAARHARGRRRGLFALMAASTGFGLCGDLTWSVLVFYTHTAPTPSLADVFYLVSLGLIGPALWAEFGSPFAHWRELLDVAMGFVIFLYIALVQVVEPQAAGISNASAGALGETVLAVIAGIWVAGALITAPRRLPLAVRLVSWAIVVQAATWLAYADVVSVQGIQDGSWTYAGWQATWAILIVAAVAEVAGQGGSVGAARRPRATGVWVTTVGLAVLIGLILVLEHGNLDADALVLAAIGVLIVVMRLHLALRERGRLAAQLRILTETDALTGVANRRVFDDRLAVAAEDAQARGRPLGMLVSTSTGSSS
jgi:hypothetical protein